MFKIFRESEMVVKKHFQDGRHINLRDNYKSVIAKIGELNLLYVCCETYPDTLSNVIMDFVVIRFHFGSKRYRNTVISKVQTSVHMNKKLSKWVNTSNKRDFQ